MASCVHPCRTNSERRPYPFDALQELLKQIAIPFDCTSGSGAHESLRQCEKLVHHGERCEHGHGEHYAGDAVRSAQRKAELCHREEHPTRRRHDRCLCQAARPGTARFQFRRPAAGFVQALLHDIAPAEGDELWRAKDGLRDKVRKFGSFGRGSGLETVCLVRRQQSGYDHDSRATKKASPELGIHQHGDNRAEEDARTDVDGDRCDRRQAFGDNLGVSDKGAQGAHPAPSPEPSRHERDEEVPQVEPKLAKHPEGQAVDAQALEVTEKPTPERERLDCPNGYAERQHGRPFRCSRYEPSRCGEEPCSTGRAQHPRACRGQ